MFEFFLGNRLRDQQLADKVLFLARKKIHQRRPGQNAEDGNEPRWKILDNLGERQTVILGYKPAKTFAALCTVLSMSASV